MKKLMMALVALVFGVMAAPAQAQTYVEGKDYVQLNRPMLQTEPGKIEVAVVFSFSSPRCFQLEPVLQAWARKLPADVYIERVHAFFDLTTEGLAQAFYTAQALRIGDQTLMPIFETIHVEHRMPRSSQDWAAFFASRGVNAALALSTFNSFGVASRVAQARSRVTGFEITSVPELVIGGKYRVSWDLAGTRERMLQIADFLIARERQARSRPQ